MEHYFDKKYELEVLINNEWELVHMSDDLNQIYMTVEHLKYAGVHDYARLNQAIIIDIKEQAILQEPIKYEKRRR